MEISEARYKANKKWNKENYSQINLTMPKNKKTEVQAHAETRGESLNGFINRAIDETIERDNNESGAAETP